MIDTLERYLFLRKCELDNEIMGHIGFLQSQAKEKGIVPKDDLRDYYLLCREQRLIIDLLDYYGGV